MTFGGIYKLIGKSYEKIIYEFLAENSGRSFTLPELDEQLPMSRPVIRVRLQRLLDDGMITKIEKRTARHNYDKSSWTIEKLEVKP